MKTYKFLAVAAVFGCYVFGSAVMAQQVCPVGGGACVSNPMPASSYTSARALDVTPRMPVVDPLGPPGSYCGWAFSDPSPDGGSYSNYPCLGHPVISPWGGFDCPSSHQPVVTGVNGSGVWASCLKL